LALPLAAIAQTNSSAPPQPSQPAASPAQPADEAKYTFNLNMPVTEFLDKIYAPLVGRTPIRTPGVNKDTAITLETVKEHPLTRPQAIMAMESILGMNNITVVNVGDKYFKVVTEARAPAAAGPLSSNAPGPLLGIGKFRTEVVQLKHADPDHVVKALGSLATYANSVIYIPSTESLILRDYTDNVNRMLDMVAILDMEPEEPIRSEVIPIRGLPAQDIAARIPPNPGQTKIIVDERTNSLLVFANDEDMKRIKKIISQDDNAKEIR